MAKTKELLPVSLQGDKNVEALCEAQDHVFSLEDEVYKLLIYPRIDSLSGEVLDLLAWQFHIEGWELAETEGEKRALIKKAIELHRYKGTPWAVINALKACGYESYMKEWFEYDGQPYLFKVYVRRPIQDNQTYQKLIAAVYEYKNARSWLDSIGTHHEHHGKLYVGATVWQGMRYTVSVNMPDFYVSPARFRQGIYYRMGNYISIGAANG
ncbi:MAG: phage tail protein I [Candidatus Bathyarchaeia archaeon]